MADRRTWTGSFEAVSVELGLVQVLSPHVKVVSDMQQKTNVSARWFRIRLILSKASIRCKVMKGCMRNVGCRFTRREAVLEEL